MFDIESFLWSLLLLLLCLVRAWSIGENPPPFPRNIRQLKFRWRLCSWSGLYFFGHGRWLVLMYARRMDLKAENMVLEICCSFRTQLTSSSSAMHIRLASAFCFVRWLQGSHVRSQSRFCMHLGAINQNVTPAHKSWQHELSVKIDFPICVGISPATSHGSTLRSDLALHVRTYPSVWSVRCRCRCSLLS